jgi:FkbM family methyltransferase
MNPQLRSAVSAVHRIVARVPILAEGYVLLLGRISRCLPSDYFRNGIYNQMAAIHWPPMDLPAASVEFVPGVTAKMIPHLEEFDFRAQFDRKLGWEEEVLRWLAGRKYKTILEIGANVGFYSLFFSRLVQPGGHVFAFEPSQEAFRRLTENLRINGVKNVTALNCAVTAKSGLVQFYEPTGHLTNGSLMRDFAALFSEQIATRTSVAIAGGTLEELQLDEPLLLKIDAEGAEETILRSMEDLIVRRKPDIVMEVLPGFEEGLNSLPFLRRCGYHFLNLTDAGPVERPHFVAGSFRDYAVVAE